jgi:hypothetical protein
LEKRNVGVESEGREVSVDGEKPASLAAAMTANGGVAAEKEKVLISMVLRKPGQNFNRKFTCDIV